MNYTWLDAGRLCLAIACYLPLLVLPGIALASLCGVVDRHMPASRRFYLALACGFAVLPYLDSTLTRFVGIEAALAVNLALGAAGFFKLLPLSWQAIDGRCLAAALVWMLVVLIAWVDFDWKGHLYQSALAIDVVKHAATSAAIAERGLPLVDPFFARDTPSSYYYYFYSLTALAQRLGGALVDARACVGALAFWCGPALLGLAVLVYERSGFWLDASRDGAANRAGVILLVLGIATGLDLLPVLLAGSAGIWYPSIDWWNEQVSSFVSSLLWVPHHVAALIAVWLGWMVLADAMDDRATRDSSRLGACGLAAVAFSSALGASVWVTGAAAVTCIAWVGLLAAERRWSAAALLVATGVVSFVLSSPFIVELLAYRSFDGSPIGLTIRAFPVFDNLVAGDTLRFVGRALLLPLNYGLELGLFLVGTVMFWRQHRLRDVHRSELARVVTVSAAMALVIATVVESKVIGNDLGWRVMLFPQLAALLWTAAVVLDRARGATASVSTIFAQAPRSLLVLLAVGWASSLYSILALRLYVIPTFHAIRYLNVDPLTDHALRQAYDWSSRHLTGDAVLQHNPSPRRALAFGLYDRHVVGVADRDANLFGAERAAVRTRMDELAPIFTQTPQVGDVRRLAAANRVDYLVVSASDPVWTAAGSWIYQVPAVYAADRVRIIAVSTLPGSKG